MNNGNNTEMKFDPQTGQAIYENDKSQVSRQSNTKIIVVIFSCIVTILVLALSVLLFIYFKEKQNILENTNESLREEKLISEQEYKSIIDLYGKSAELAVQDYMKLYSGLIPSFGDIISSIHFNSYDVECGINKVNYDGSIYLSDCKINNENLNYKYIYGKLLQEPQKTGDKIYIYKSSQNSVKLTTGENISFDNYIFNNQFVDYSATASINLIKTYECYSKDCKGYDVNPLTNEVLLYDGAYYLYNLITDEKRSIYLGDEVYSNINYIVDENKTYGLAVKNSQKVAFYNFDASIYVTGFEYDRIYSLNKLVKRGFILGSKSDGTNIINLSDGSIYKKLEYNLLDEEMVNNNVFYHVYPKSEGLAFYYEIYNSDFEKFIPIDQEYENVSNTNNTITTRRINANTFEVYDLLGNLIYTSREYKKIVKIVRDYVIVLDNDNNLNVIDLSENVIAKLANIPNNYRFHPMMTGYYKADSKDGIYVLVENEDIPYGTLGSGIEYYYIPATGETGFIETEGVGGYAKPVLYLYPEGKTAITIDFEKEYLLTTTYPKFKSNWEVTAYPNGDLYDKKGNYYYGLYWEENGSTNVDFSTGFYVAKENAIDFLEEKLSIIGLNDRERNEFIMYWLPILEKNEKNLVYFELTEERENYNKIFISPQPDSILRLAIHVKKVKEHVSIKEQKLPTFNRKGFTAVEWGGVVHN